MNSVRSEYSDSLGTGRLGGGGASLSFADSSSVGSSRLSTTRSDFLSNYEQKFLERKAEKKKKREREKRLADATNNQLTADDKRRADREAERLVRKAEMATWLPTTAMLRQRERERHKRSRETLEEVLRWYPTVDATDVPFGLKRHTEIQPLFVPDAAQAREREAQARELKERIEREASALDRRALALQHKVGCVERLAVTRRLAPLTRSTATLPSGNTSLRGSRSSATLATSYLFRDSPDDDAHAKYLEALELNMFLDAHKRKRRREVAARTIQAAWRMVRTRRKFRRWQKWRTATRRMWFDVWALSTRLTKQAQRAVKRRCFRAWREHVTGAVRLRQLELRLYREAALAPEVPKVVWNLVLMTDDDDDAYTRKVLAHPMKPSYYTGFVNAAFASVEQHALLTTQHRTRLVRAQHIEARRAVAKKIVQRLFLLWKRVHLTHQRLGLNAQLCLKRAARQAFQKRPVWAAEKLLTVFELWARYTAFARSKRLHIPMPHFATPQPLWDVWLHNYQERQIRQVKAAAKAPLARMRRCFCGFRAFATFARRERLAFERATRHFRCTTNRAVLLAWRAAIADSAAMKKLLRSVLSAWQAYASRKRTLRPYKQQIIVSRLRREQQRAWGAWRNVQLRSCFKRELNRARLMSQPMWRWKVQRLLLTWMDIRTPLVKWKCFVAWKHLVQRRKLYLTVRKHCRSLRQRHLLYGVFSAWKAVVWKQEEEFLEDRLQLSAWDTYRELSPLLPMLFYGCFSDAGANFGGVSTANVASSRPPSTTEAEDVLVKRQREIRTFHDSLLHGSVTEVRNLILNHRHLVNGVDDLTGNTALHVVAGQLEDDIRRREITTLLLCEGACSEHKSNRHGLRPAQLTPDEITRRLLDRGIYAAHTDGILQRSVVPSETAEARLLWCLVARMSSEYVRGDRIAGDFRREWYSELQDELWLRRGRIAFASTSEFSAPIHRCRAFLNGMKRRICRSKEDVLLDLSTRVQKETVVHRTRISRRHSTVQRPALIKRGTRSILSRDLARMEEKIDLLSWLKNTPEDPTSPGGIQEDIEETEEETERILTQEKIQALGEYGAYGEVLLWPVLHDEAAEHDLVHSFVGVLFSLGFPVDVVLIEATRLESDCNSLENEVLQGYQAIMRAELRCRSPDQPHGLPLLRYFSEQSDAELLFKRELLELNIELLRQQQQMRGLGSDKTPRLTEDKDSEWSIPPVAELQLEADVLLAKVQRKQRKVDKKAVAAEQHVLELTDANTRVLLDAPISLSSERFREICDARIRLEEARFRLAGLRLKQVDWAAKANEMLALKRSLDAPEVMNRVSESGDMDEDEMLARRAFLEAQLKLYVHELKPNGSSRAGVSMVTTRSLTELRRLHKRVSTTLWVLYIKNLFRSCCCWLAENLIKYQQQEDFGDEDADETANDQEYDSIENADYTKSSPSSEATIALRKQTLSQPGSGQRMSVAMISEPVTTVVTNTFAAARKASVAIQGPPDCGGRRRSSLENARATLDTMQRSATTAEQAEIQTNLMRENYTNSSQLLFESDRDAMLEEQRLVRQREMDIHHQTQRRMKQSPVVELNPTTGLPEGPPSRLLETEEIAAMINTFVHEAAQNEEMKSPLVQQRNRKRELVRRAMAQRQLERLWLGSTGDGGDATAHGDDSKRTTTTFPKKWHALDGVIGVGDESAEVGFGNFVMGSKSCTDNSHVSLEALTAPVVTADKTVAGALAESMWKRGGTMRRPSAVAGRGVSPLAAVGSGSPGFELFASAEDEMAFNTAFRVMSASKERRTTTSGRRLSSIGAVAGNGLRAASPHEETHAPVESLAEGKDEVLFGEFNDLPTFLPVENTGEDVEGEVRGENFVQVIGEEPSEDAQSSERNITPPTDDPLRSDLASLVSPTDESEFFGQTLQQYLERVRRDSFVDINEGTVEYESSTLPVDVDEPEPPVNEVAVADTGASSAEQLRTPHIKWADNADEPPHPRPLHVESTRLLVPTMVTGSDNLASLCEHTVLLETLHELERKEEDERRRRQLSNEQLLLSGKTSTLVERRRRSVASTLVRKSSSVLASTAQTDDGTKDSAGCEDKDRDVIHNPYEATSINPNVPKVLVAIQRKPTTTEDPGGSIATGGDNGVDATTKTKDLSIRKQSQQLSLPTAQCELRLEPTRIKMTNNHIAQTRRRTIQVESDKNVPSTSRKRQATRRSASPIALCLEGASALVSATAFATESALNDPEPPNVHLPELTEEQKREIWREFTSVPLTGAMQDAYAELYPHLYQSMTPLSSVSSTVLVDQSRPSTTLGEAMVTPLSSDAPLTLQHQIALDKRFWSAVEGFKAVGGAGLVVMDEKMRKRRRIESAVAIYQQYLSPTAPHRLPWLSTYSGELRAIERRLLMVPRTLFDALQETAQLRISTLLAHQVGIA